MTWSFQEIFAAASLVALLAIGIGSFLSLRSTINGTVKRETECRLHVLKHMSDTSIHRDVQRDEARWDDLYRRFDLFEQKVERLLTK